MSKYELKENDWDTDLVRNVTFRSPWKFISRTYLAFHQLMKATARGGNKIRFWKGRWWRDSFSKDLYHTLF